MIDGSKSEPPFCVRSWLKKIKKKNCLQEGVVRKKLFAEVHRLKKKFAERDFSSPPPPPEK